MTVLSAQSIRKLCSKPDSMVTPFYERRIENGMSFGLSAAGYDVRCREPVLLKPHGFSLASTIERFCIPTTIMAGVADKSTWARRGLAVQNTILEPGWSGYLTLELTNHGPDELLIEAGDPIAQIIFHWLDEETDRSYRGKYQGQGPGPVAAIRERGREASV